ncbi:hypothetical protein ALC152_04910 [Arcobacter sp. 15-2]|uniref:hypothetical protein n=1 Tax=Arcobacter sp. 15-2 TaxID=3374109 RepID=UPI00399C73B1
MITIKITKENYRKYDIVTLLNLIGEESITRQFSREFYNLNSRKINSALIHSSYTDASVLNDLALENEDDVLVCTRIASNSATSLDTLKFFLKKFEEDKLIKIAVAKNPNCSEEMLKELMKNKTERDEIERGLFGSIERSISTNPSATKEMLNELFLLDIESIQKNVLANPNCPVELIEDASKSEDEDFRAVVASNTATPATILKKLSKDRFKVVKLAIASNTATPVDVLEKMLLLKDEEILINLICNDSVQMSKLIYFSTIHKSDRINAVAEREISRKNRTFK